MERLTMYLLKKLLARQNADILLLNMAFSNEDLELIADALENRVCKHNKESIRLKSSEYEAIRKLSDNEIVKRDKVQNLYLRFLKVK